MDYCIQTLAKNSLTHRHNQEFLNCLENAVHDIDNLGDEFSEMPPSILRDRIINKDPMVTAELLDCLEDFLVGNFTEDEYGEEIASVGYDHDGPAHSGWNGVYEFCGLYLLSGSDYHEGPSLDKYELLEYLNTEDSRHDVFWTEYAD